MSFDVDGIRERPGWVEISFTKCSSESKKTEEAEQRGWKDCQLLSQGRFQPLFRAS